MSAYVKVSDGCDRRCAFCAVPLIKGDYETVLAGDVLRRAHAALSAGAREIVLVGQDTSRWTQPGWGGVSRLLSELAALDPAPDWLRLLYLQPDGVDDGPLRPWRRTPFPTWTFPCSTPRATSCGACGDRGTAPLT